MHYLGLVTSKQFNKGTFSHVICLYSKLLFLGDNFGGACNFWSDPYLNSTTVLFDYFQKQR